jgi:hypothetical protein
VIGFDRPQLLHQAVVLGVGDLGRVEHVVLVVVVIDQLAQLFCSDLQALEVLDLRWHGAVAGECNVQVP